MLDSPIYKYMCFNLYRITNYTCHSLFGLHARESVVCVICTSYVFEDGCSLSWCLCIDLPFADIDQRSPHKMLDDENVG